MILRGLVAIGFGLLMGALCAWLLIAGDDLLDARHLRLFPFVLMAGIVLAAPGWGLSCVIVLPVVTHRTRVHGLPAPIPYFAIATAVGAIAGLPTFLFLAAFDGGVLRILLTGGIAGGLAIALMWRVLILNPIAARRETLNGASLG